MDDLREAGFWFVVAGFVATFVYNGLNYLRNPAYVRRSRLDEVLSTVTQLREEISDLRNENTELKSQVKQLMAKCEFYLEAWREEKSKNERRAPL